jgi:glutaminyl-tRNA synthetase
MSKRHLRALVENGTVDGWDDPRMPTLCGLRRRGYTAASILDFIDRIGVSKSNSLVDIRLLESCIREELNEKAERRIAVLNPIKVVVTNYPEGEVEYFEVPNNPAKPELGTRKLAFTRELYIDSDDFAEVPPPKFFRMKPDGEVRLMGAYIVKCNEIVKDDNGNLVEIRCTADLETGNGMPVDGRKVKGTIHWLSKDHAKDTTVMLYDFLFDIENTSDIPEDKTYDDYLNKASVTKIEGAKIEPSLDDAKAGDRFQFVRTGYFVKDTKHENTFNRIVGLKDSFPKTK